MSDDIHKKIPKEPNEEDFADFWKEEMEEARVNPIWFPDGTSTQDILPIEEQWHPRDEHGKNEFDYGKDIEVTPERAAATKELIRKMRMEHGGPFSDHWVNPAKKKQD